MNKKTKGIILTVGFLIAMILECEGEFMGRPGSGKTFEIATFNVMRIRDGQVVDEWDEFDTLGFLAQLGIVEKP